MHAYFWVVVDLGALRLMLSVRRVCMPHREAPPSCVPISPLHPKNVRAGQDASDLYP
jgi:hypothetical protein